MNSPTTPSQRPSFKTIKRIVCKIGSSLLTNGGRGLDAKAMEAWAMQIADIRAQNIEVLVVTSGAIAEGILRLNWKVRPTALHELQAAAAVGQMGLAQAWENALNKAGLKSAQILLTHDDLKERGRYLNARSTLTTLLEFGVIPIINENDTVVTDEIKLGDNDTLGALVTNLLDADMLILLTDQDGLYSEDPRKNPQAHFIFEATAGDKTLISMAGSAGSAIGTGGMVTKINAATRAAKSGASTIIANGKTHRILIRLLSGERLGTYLGSQTPRVAARKQWLANHLRVAGTLILDDGAIRALVVNHRSLLPVGVTGFNGQFSRGDVVSCVDKDGIELARGLVNYPAHDVQKIVGQESSKIQSQLGYSAEPELIHRDNLVITGHSINLKLPP